MYKMLYMAMDASIELLIKAIKIYLQRKNLYADMWSSYFSELGKFGRLRKQELITDDAVLSGIFRLNFVKLKVLGCNFAAQQASMRHQKTNMEFF